MLEEDLVCYCFEVPRDEIIEIIQKNKACTVDDIQLHCSACLGCGGCRPDLEELLETFSPPPFSLKHGRSSFKE